jgi:hypothetical protein
VNYEGGPYLLSKHKLAAGETKTFDFRKLRDEQIPDWKGHTLPASFMRGQFRWGIHGGGANARLTGRAEILSLSERVSSSYSCDEICPPSFDYALPLNPESITIPVGGSVLFTVEEIDQDCYGGPIGPNPVSDSTWYIDFPDVAAGDAGIFYGVGPGVSFIHASWQSPYYNCSEGAGCGGGYFNVSADAEMIVAKVALEIDGVADSDKESVGGLVVRNFDGNDAPREMITIESPQVSVEGFIELTVSNSSKVKVFTAATGGTQITFNGTDNRFEFSSLPMSLYVEGVEPSNDMRDVTFSAKLVGNSSFVDQAKATVVSVEMPTVSFTGSTSTNNDKRGNYKNWTKEKTDELGPQVYTNEFPSLYDARLGWGIEASAVVKPAGFNYRNNDLKLERDLESIDYFGSTPSPTKTFSATIPPGNDTSAASLRDDNPMPDGMIYDLDAPGLSISTAAQDAIRRTRNNFKVFASITRGGKKVRVSPIRDCFIRFSMKQLDAPGGKNWVFLSPPDIPNDNQAGYGTTKLSLNLQ